MQDETVDHDPETKQQGLGPGKGNREFMKSETQRMETEMDGAAGRENTIGLSESRRYVHVGQGNLADQALKRIIAKREGLPGGLNKCSVGEGLSGYREPSGLEINAYDIIGRKHTATGEADSHATTQIKDPHHLKMIFVAERLVTSRIQTGE